MKKVLAVIASAAIVSFAPSFAAAAPAAAAPAAAASTADPAVTEATKQMLSAMKMHDAMMASLQQLEQQMPAQMQAAMVGTINGNPNLSAEQKAEALKKAQAALPQMAAQMHALFSDPTLVDDILAEVVPLYAQTYTLDEIRQMSAFYTSPVGQKMLASMPKLMAQSMEISNRVMMPRMQKILAQAQAASKP